MCPVELAGAFLQIDRAHVAVGVQQVRTVHLGQIPSWASKRKVTICVMRSLA